MTSQSQGIQQLLQAEKRAKDKLEEAKKTAVIGSHAVLSGKGKRLKQAKEEATAEIDHYRLQREKDFRHKQSNIMGSQGNLSTKIDEETVAKIQDHNSNYHKNMERVMGRLLDEVYGISPELHPNYAYTI
ncbi:V-type proton ATPase subunit G 3 isoform X1 [Rhineura floridana]|uniref:V-type proton ATPase subunit G 3 isoform X1 n=1 Tax=Rhineura floridana TaxID=261503 RepID=UPI002AC8833B|nr:V-type proton ATPase subunit G 3 isoform X1 [Rhineura floridana]